MGSSISSFQSFCIIVALESPFAIMFTKICIFVVLLGVCLSRPDSPPSYGYQPAHQPQPEGPAQYNFDWAVKDDYSGNDFGQQEQRDGYDTQGSYYVLLPDGRRQIVTYSVNGDSGFVADVQYEGEASYPEQQASYQPKPQPSYQPKPQPSYQPKPQPSYQPKPQPSYQ